MIWSTVKGAFMLQSSEIFVASGLLFPPSYILLVKKSTVILWGSLIEHSPAFIAFVYWFSFLKIKPGLSCNI